MDNDICKINELDKNYSKEEIINNLKSEEIDDFVKIFSIIHLDKTENQLEFNILINNLTNHSTPIREITAHKLDEINNYNNEFFIDNFSLLKILDAITDINPNVSRIMCNIIQNNNLLKEKIEDYLHKGTKPVLTSVGETKFKWMSIVFFIIGMVFLVGFKDVFNDYLYKDFMMLLIPLLPVGAFLGTSFIFDIILIIDKIKEKSYRGYNG